MESEMRYEYRITSDAPHLAPRRVPSGGKPPSLAFMAMYAHEHINDGAPCASLICGHASISRPQPLDDEPCAPSEADRADHERDVERENWK